MPEEELEGEMEPKDNGEGWLKNTGDSIPVPNVQALVASMDLSELPERYIRPEMKAEQIHGSDEEGDVPVIDFSRLLHPRYSHEETIKLKFACEEWGFFKLINHGVPDEVIQKMKDDVQEFFLLPLKEKEAYAPLPGAMEGYGQVFVLSEEQKLDWGDVFFLVTQPPNARNIRLWPTKPPTFSAALDKYTTELKKVVNCLLRSMAKNLGLKPEVLTDIFEEGVHSLRMNYYPPCPHADKVLGLSTHSDSVGLTLLLEVNEVPGLQIKRNGGWIPIKPLPSAFTVNIGDIMEIMTNGKYKSIEHRAVINTEKERLSVVAFHNPNRTARVGPLPELVTEGKEYFKSLSYSDFLRMLFSTRPEGKNILDCMKLTK